MKKLLSFIIYSAYLHNAYAQDEPAQELDAMTVTATAESSQPLSKAMTVLSDDELRGKVGASLGETLNNELGMSSQSFGAGVGTPMIRGQSSSRVKVLQNSVGNNDAAALSPDHANGVEPILAERIEVLRGASTLLYGNGSIGGVVNVIDNRIPEKLFDKVLGGAAEQRYDSVSNQTATVGKVEGSYKQLAYHLDGFYRDQDNTSISGFAIDEQAVRATDHSLDGVKLINSKGVIANTQAQSQGGSIGASWITEKGLIGVSINQLDKNYGIPSDGSGGDAINIALKQSKYDLKAQLNKPLAIADTLKFKFAYTDYQHQELENAIPATTFLNKSYESRLELQHKAIGQLTGVWGFQSLNTEFSALGAETIVPPTVGDTYGLFAVESLKQGSINYQAGLRGEWQTIKAQQQNTQTYFPLSGSLSASWDINKQQQLSIAFTHAQRAPQIQELYSNGVHDATRSYEQGNANLKKEASNNIDLSYRWRGDSISAELNLFHNWVSDYIYQQRTGEVFNENTEQFAAGCANNNTCVPVLENQQTAAIFKGFEAKIVLPLLDTKAGLLDLTLFSDYTRGTFDKGGNVPRLPPLRYGLQLDYDYNNWHNELRLTRAEAQTDVAANDSTSPAYVLLNLNSQYHLAHFANTDILLFAKAKNLLNENIRNATSYLRNFAPEAGRGAEIGIRVSY
jgi:iron complex outermembrane receptor protein